MTPATGDALATLMLLGLVVMIGRELVQEKPVRTRTADSTRLTLEHYGFDMFSCHIEIDAGFTQGHELVNAGHFVGVPRLTRTTVMYARLLDPHGRTHAAGVRELRQIQDQLDRDRAAQGRLQRELEREVA